MHWRSVRPEMVTTGTNRFPHFGQCVIRSMRSLPITGGKLALSLFETQLCPSLFARLREAVWQLRASNHRKPQVGMSIIPLHVQRPCERRWAARFSRPAESVAPRNQRPERESQQIARPDKSKRKTHRAEAGSRPLSEDRSPAHQPKPILRSILAPALDSAGRL
jgi:hypothetical protein